jgi:hypothetical protein
MKFLLALSSLVCAGYGLSIIAAAPFVGVGALVLGAAVLVAVLSSN